MKEPEIDDTPQRNEGKGLRLMHSEKRESLLPDPDLKALIDKMKGKPKRVKLKFDDGPEAA